MGLMGPPKVTYSPSRVCVCLLMGMSPSCLTYFKDLLLFVQPRDRNRSQSPALAYTVLRTELRASHVQVMCSARLYPSLFCFILLLGLCTCAIR